MIPPGPSVRKVIQNLGAADIDTRLEEQLIDGILFAFQEQVSPMALEGWHHACGGVSRVVFSSCASPLELLQQGLKGHRLV